MRVVNWFQIPVKDIERASAFYAHILGLSLQRADDEHKRAFFPMGDNPDVAGGELMQAPFLKPSMEGVLIYLNCPDGVDAVLERVSGAGGQMLMPKTPIPPHGFIATIRDTEGNSIGLHAYEH